MNRKKCALFLGLILILVPFARPQTQTDTVTLKGTVGETSFLSNNDLHVWLQREREGTEVCLGSARYLDDQGFLPCAGDMIEVTGRWAGNGSLLVANSLQMGGKTLTPSPASARPGCPNCG